MPCRSCSGHSCKRENGVLQAEVRTLLVDMGSHAIVPLTTRLPELDPVSQETVINVLRDIPYSSSVPFIYDVRATTQVNTVKAAAEEAIRKITGAVNDDAALGPLRVARQRLLHRVAEPYQLPRRAEPALVDIRPGSPGCCLTPASSTPPSSTRRWRCGTPSGPCSWIRETPGRSLACLQLPERSMVRPTM